jgi:CheY-like chemotaxis protein
MPSSRQIPTRVLIVDDNMPAADSLARLLNKIGMRADALYSGHDALEVVTRDAYDILLLDIGMPGMDGYELVKLLRKRGIDSPIVALSGYGLADDKQQARDAGFTAHLTKPVGLQEIRTLFDTFETRQKTP